MIRFLVSLCSYSDLITGYLTVPLWRLEPYAVKVARTVLRRVAPGNRCRLSDKTVLRPDKPQSKKRCFFGKGVDITVSFGFEDETVKRPWMASQRLAEVSTHRVVLRHPAYTTLVHPCTAPTAGD